MTACASLPIAILPCGISTAQVMPARAAYAAAEADVLPVDAHSTAFWPRATASVTAIVMPRSLNEPVGLSPSTLRCTVQPVYSDNRGAGQQRGAALEQGDRRPVVLDREPVAVGGDQPGPGLVNRRVP